MIKSLARNLSIFILLSLVAGAFFAPKADAQVIPLTNLSDTISTSRPSAAAPLSTGISANATSATIIDNGSMYLASDSAVIYPDTSETIDVGKNVSSMSAQLAGPTRTVYFSGPCAGYGCFANTHHIGDALIVNVTAMHTISFKTVTTIPASGKISITFPGSAAVIGATPSASTFSFNGLTSANASTFISYKLDGTRTCTTWTVATAGNTPTITCNMDGGGTLAGGTTVTFLIGCGDSSSNESSCTSSKPILINPTKTATAGTADLWKLYIGTFNGSGNPLDSGRITIGTIESVQVQATVDPTLTFTIAAVSGLVNSGNTGCTSGDSVNSGIPSTATTVNLGLLNTSTINISAQLITISTNGRGGYSLTATSSGHLIDPTSGVWIRDNGNTPALIASGAPWFGVHACGTDVNGTTWGAGATPGVAKYAWPTVTTPLTLATDASGPIGIGGTTNGLTTVEYAGAVDVSIPAGLYFSTITYTATPTF